MRDFNLIRTAISLILAAIVIVLAIAVGSVVLEGLPNFIVTMSALFGGLCLVGASVVLGIAMRGFEYEANDKAQYVENMNTEVIAKIAEMLDMLAANGGGELSFNNSWRVVSEIKGFIERSHFGSGAIYDHKLVELCGTLLVELNMIKMENASTQKASAKCQVILAHANGLIAKKLAS